MIVFLGACLLPGCDVLPAAQCRRSDAAHAGGTATRRRSLTTSADAADRAAATRGRALKPFDIIS